ncbi:MAG: prephenate dehydrogenase [Candidatus Nanopelagicaceae bacterium]|nr:prephenate dehydrogenase [Candidatus Nanopelagicaceae bacterium]
MRNFENPEADCAYLPERYFCAEERFSTVTRRGARIVGAGLIGTSIALRLKEKGWSVDIRDSDPVNQAIARDLVGAAPESLSPELVVVATPPSSVFETLKGEFGRYPNATFIDVTSVKTKLHVEIEAISGLFERFVGTHPVSGRESGGPQSARSDLFDGRAWVITSDKKESTEPIRMAEELIRVLGGVPYQMTPAEHDQLFARISHLPQVLSTSLAAAVETVGESIDLAGQGLRDMLRLSGSKAELWGEILFANSGEVLESINELKLKISEIERAIQQGDTKQLASIFATANAVHGKLSGKHGLRPREYSYLNVVIEDKPGQLGALFNECAEIDANVEDLALEHSPKQETGLIRLALFESHAEKLRLHLLNKGWRVHRQ